MRARPLTLIQDDLVDYDKAMERMSELVAERQRDARPDTLWLLSHPQVYTVGRRTPASHLPDPSHGIPVVETGRGGQLTYHGPGQLVGYLIVKLDEGEGIVDYVREVELRLVDALGKLGLPAERRDTPPGSELLTGVWTVETGRDAAEPWRHQPRLRPQRGRRPHPLELGGRLRHARRGHDLAQARAGPRLHG
jgi:lipoyl(octanoyl) transferase